MPLKLTLDGVMAAAEKYNLPADVAVEKIFAQKSSFSGQDSDLIGDDRDELRKALYDKYSASSEYVKNTFGGARNEPPSASDIPIQLYAPAHRYDAELICSQFPKEAASLPDWIQLAVSAIYHLSKRSLKDPIPKVQRFLDAYAKFEESSRNSNIALAAVLEKYNLQISDLAEIVGEHEGRIENLEVMSCELAEAIGQYLTKQKARKIR